MSRSRNVDIQKTENFLQKFDVYGNNLFKIYGELRLLQLIYNDIRDIAKFKLFINEYSAAFIYQLGDQLEVTEGRPDFTVEITKKFFNDKFQGYMIVTLPISPIHALIFSRLVKIFDYDIDMTPPIPIYTPPTIPINKMNLSFLLMMHDSAHVEEFTNCLGFVLCFKYIIESTTFGDAIRLLKQFPIFITDFGSNLWIEQKVSSDEWFHYFDTSLEGIFVGKTTRENQKFLGPICKRGRIECDYTDIMRSIQAIADEDGGGITKHVWFNSILGRGVTKINIVFKHEKYVFGSGIELDNIVQLDA